MRSIGGYRIHGRLGRGGMGAVYKAAKPGSPLVALKVLDPAEMLEAITGMEELERRFLAEAEIMQGFRHPNIAPVESVGRDASGRPFFTMEYCCENVGALIGETYRVEDPSRVLTVDRAADIALQTLSGLGELHARGVVHRDVKPFNLLLAPGQAVRIIDFGLSKLRGERIRLHGAEQVGSPFYAAPEQEASPDAVDGRADLYGVGVMLYRMLTGRLPELFEQEPSALNTDLDDQWDALLHCATHPDPEQRFASAEAMAGAITEAVRSWAERTQASCRLPGDAPDEEFLTLPWPAPLRRNPVHTGPKVRPQDLGLDALWRPEAYCRNDFTAHGAEVYDAATGLVWQQGCSPEAMDWPTAHGYVDALNARLPAGAPAWRLPTAEELLSLVEPVQKGRAQCAPPLFSTVCRRLWSADRRTYAAAWYADMELGFLGAHDTTCMNWVRAVRDA
ncbi:protein kinase domain-containing protein [Desulfobaculum sp.]